MTPEFLEPTERDLDREMPRKPYDTPRLTVHGRIEDITAAAGVTNSDGPLGSTLI